jgi:Protein of unknown function C-terminus (DUF2451)
MSRTELLIAAARTFAELSNEEVFFRIRELRVEESRLREQLNGSIVSQLAEVGSARNVLRALLENAKETATRAADVRIALAEASASNEKAVQSMVSLKDRRGYLEDMLSFVSRLLALRILSSDARAALQQGDNRRAYSICTAFDAEYSEVLGLYNCSTITCLDTASDFILNTAVDSLRLLHGSLRFLCRRFDAEEYRNILVSYREIGDGVSMRARILAEFEAAASAVLKMPVQGHCPSILAESISLTFFELGDLIGNLDMLVRFHEAQKIETISGSIWTEQDERFRKSLTSSICGCRDIFIRFLIQQANVYIVKHTSAVASLPFHSFAGIYRLASQFMMICRLVASPRAVLKVSRSGVLPENLSDDLKKWEFPSSNNPDAECHLETLNAEFMFRRGRKEMLRKSSRGENLIFDRFLSTLATLHLAAMKTLHTRQVEQVRVSLDQEGWSRIRVTDADISNIQVEIENVFERSHECKGEVLDDAEQISTLELLESGQNPLRAFDHKMSEPKAMGSIKTENHQGPIPSHCLTFSSASTCVLRCISTGLQTMNALQAVRKPAVLNVIDLVLLLMHHVVAQIDSRASSESRQLSLNSLRHGFCKPGDQAVVSDFMTQVDRQLIFQLKSRYEEYTNDVPSIDKISVLVQGAGTASGANGVESALRLPPYQPTLSFSCPTHETRLETVQKIAVAIESVHTVNVFLMPMRPWIDSDACTFLDPISLKFVKVVLATVTPLREAVYRLLAWDICGGWEAIGAILGEEKYSREGDVTDTLSLASEPSRFIFVLIRRVKLSMGISLPPESLELLSTSLCEMAMEMAMEGFAEVQGCTACGRSQMLFDVISLDLELERVTGLHPIPGKDRVQKYVQAWFLEGDDLREWVHENRNRLRMEAHHIRGLEKPDAAIALDEFV